MSDMSWIEGRNFKLDVRFKFAFRLEFSIAPNGTVLISETDQGLEICLEKSPKSKKGESDRTSLKIVVGEKN